jgi:hypothetical protein
MDKTNEKQDERIQKVIGHIKNDEMKSYKEWSSYLVDIIGFPFEAEVDLYQESNYFIHYGDRLKVMRIDGEEDLYGIIVEVRVGRKKRYFPLCELKAIDTNDEVNQALFDYGVWFANR